MAPSNRGAGKRSNPNKRNTNPAPNNAAARAGKPLGGQSKRIAFQRTYHGTTAQAARKIREGGYVASPNGVYGPGVYTGNKKMAQQYARAAGGENGRVLAHRVPKRNQQTVPFQKPEGRQRVSPLTGQVQDRLKQGKTTRVNYGKGSQVTPLSAKQANKTLVPANGQLRVSKAQAAKIRAPRSQRLGYDNVARSEPGYFKPGRGNIRFGAQTEINQALKNLKKDGGFSVQTGRAGQAKGNMVAIDGKVLRNPTPQRLQRFLEQNKGILSRPDAAVGGWVSKRSGKPVVEISRRIPSGKEAQRLGKKFQQEGTYNTRTGQYTSTGGNDQLRHTKGNQTAGGSRIGGQKQLSRLKANRSGTIKKPAAVPARKTQGTPLVNRDGSKRTIKGAMRPTKPVAPPTGANGQRNFTPARRAQANLRRITEPGKMERVVKYGNRLEIKTHLLPGSNKYAKIAISPDGSLGDRRHAVEFGHLKTEGNPYASNKELGIRPRSNVKTARDKASLKALLGRTIDNNVEVGDRIVATPTNRARAGLYSRATNRALKSIPTEKGNPNAAYQIDTVRSAPNRWRDTFSGTSTEWDPSKMRDALKAQASSKATLVGRRAGGTSNVKAQRVPKGSGQKPKFTKPDNVTPLKRALARPSKLFPRGGQLIPQPWNAPPYFPSAIRSQGRHRGIEAGLGQRGHVFETAYRNEIVRRGLNPNEYPGQRVVDEVLEVAQRATMRHYNNTQPPQRDWSRTDARTERIRARGGELQPLRQRGPQDPQLRARWQASQGNQAPRSVGAMGAPAPTRKELPKVNRPGTIRSNKAARNSLKVAPAVKPPSALRRVGGVAGKAVGPAFAAWDYTDRRSQGQSRSQAATGTGLGTVGGWAGAVAGAKAGATAGALLGPKGAAIGGLVGGLAGANGGYEALNKVNDRIYQEGQKRKNPPKPTPKPLYGTGRVASIVPTRPQPQPQQKPQAKPSEADRLKVKKRR